MLSRHHLYLSHRDLSVASERPLAFDLRSVLVRHHRLPRFHFRLTHSRSDPVMSSIRVHCPRRNSCSLGWWGTDLFHTVLSCLWRKKRLVVLIKLVEKLTWDHNQTSTAWRSITITTECSEGPHFQIILLREHQLITWREKMSRIFLIVQDHEQLAFTTWCAFRFLPWHYNPIRSISFEHSNRTDNGWSRRSNISSCEPE